LRPNRSYLWILARRPVLDEAVLRRLTAEARAAGFETEKLIFVQHDAP
jgi:apolipoprotein D and lipocalin family protein